jgi:hypothetical protein
VATEIWQDESRSSISDQPSPIANLKYPYAISGYRKRIFQIGERVLLIAD